MKTIGLREVTELVRGHVPKKDVTTAHLQGFKFFRREYYQAQRQPSILKRIARARSPFVIEETLKDCQRFFTPNTRTWRSWRRAARARLAELRGEVLAPQELNDA